MSERLKMRDLERLTGVGRETIRYYIRQGLLPEPERPSRNVAWYDARFVEQIRFIKELQRQRYLPLSVIRTIVRDDQPPPPDEIQALMALDGKLVPGATGARERLSEAGQRTGLRVKEIRELAAAGLCEIDMRDGDQWLDETGIRIVELWARLREAGFVESLGFVPKNMTLHVEMMRWLARQELRIFSHAITGRRDAETSASMAEAGIDLINEMLALVRKATLLRYVAEGNVPVDDDVPGARAS